MYYNKLFISSFLITSLVLFSACGGAGSDSEKKTAKTSSTQTTTEEPSESKSSNDATNRAEDKAVEAPTAEPVVPPVEETVVPPVEETVVPPVEETVVEPVIVNGVTLVDASSVGGIDYKCGTKEGTSNSLGVMDCQANSMSLFLGNLQLGTVSNIHEDKIVYTTELLNQPRGATLYPDVTKVSILLQSLDKDGDISNGIVIDKSALFITNQYFSTYTKLSELSSEEFANIVKEIVIKIHEKSSRSSVTFVGAQDAQDNLTARIATPLN